MSATDKIPALLAFILLYICCSCKDKDRKIKADLTAKAKESIGFAGVSFTVEGGVVTLTGSTPTAEMRMEINNKVKGLYGVKDLVNNITIAPVVIGTDRPLKLKVDSVLQDYPAVRAIVQDSMVALEGRVEGERLHRLLGMIQELRPRVVENRLSTK